MLFKLNILWVLGICLGFYIHHPEDPRLIGKWQLVYFDGIDQIKQSARYQNASAAARQDMDYRIANRLENTVYEFFEGDSLVFTDFGAKGIVQRQANIKVENEDLLHIVLKDEVRKAKIVEISENRLVLEPISETGTLGKLIFEPWVAPED